MSIVVVSEYALWRDMISTSLMSRGVSPIRTYARIGEVPPLAEGELLLILAEGTTEETRAVLSMAHLRHPRAHIVALVHPENQVELAEHPQQGVDAVLANDASIDALVGALALVENGYRLMQRDPHNDETPVVAAAQSDMFPSARIATAEPSCAELSRRERAVVTRLKVGHSNRDIACDLGISEATVKVHLRAAFRKIGVHNRTQAAIWANENL